MANQPRLKPVPAIVAEIRRLSDLLAERAEVLHAASGIGGAMRGILELLADRGPATVPGLARIRGVSRQHVQTVVDRLAESGLVDPLANPAHSRSPLIAATERGVAALREIRAREAPIGAELATAVSAEDAAIAVRALAALRERLESMNEADLQPARSRSG